MTSATTTTATAPTTTTHLRTKNAAPAQGAPAVVAAPAMQLTVLQEQLKRALAIVMHAAAGKSTLPILSNVLLVAEGSRLKISATDLEIGIVAVIEARVAQEGAITLPAKLLSDVVSSLPNDTITLDMDARTQSVHLTCGCFECNIKGIDAEEFPIIPTLSGQAPAATFAPEALRSAIHQVAFAAATNDSRPILRGVQIALRGALVSLVAADGFRLTFRDLALAAPVAKAQVAVIPAHALAVLGKLLGSVDGDVALLISSDGNQVVFRSAELELVARLIDGKYPNTSKFEALEGKTVLEIETKELAKAVKLASFFASASANVIRLTLLPSTDGKGTLKLSANAAEVGDNESVHDATIRGNGGEVALNVSFLAEGIDAIATPMTAIHFNHSQQPVVLRGVGDETYAYIAMPMTIR